MHHTIIIGAGPAGLAAAASLNDAGIRDILLFERGKSLADRQRSEEEDIASGIGGAGLFSDGKFSFYPSATWLWKKLEADPLSISYQWLTDILQAYQVSPPNFQDRSTEPLFNGAFKAYPSFYIDFENRYHMINQWREAVQDKLLTNTTVTNIERRDKGYCITTNAGFFFARHVVIATGRMGPLQLAAFNLSLNHEFQRIEIGMRIKGHYTHPFFRDLQQHGQYIDPKFIFTQKAHPALSWRTFCFCNRGEIMNSGSDGYVALSGRADCPPTEESNIGFNTRIKLPEISHLLPKVARPFTLNLGDVYRQPDLLAQFYDPLIAKYVFLGLMELKQYFSGMGDADSLEIVGPTIEGVGHYPVVTNELETEHSGLYVAGDSVGLFRGLTAALLSGHYIGQKIALKEMVEIPSEVAFA
jgi:uncharacterized FAD-dependent dehydrogenase